MKSKYVEKFKAGAEEYLELLFKISTPILGRGGEIKELPLHAVENVQVKRFGMAKRITITIDNAEVQLEAAAGADEFLAAYEQLKP